MFSPETTALLRSVLDEVCEQVGRYENGTRAHVASKLLEVATRGGQTIEELKRAGHDALKKYYDEECDAALAPAVAELTARNIAFKTQKRIGEPATTIVAAANEGGFDLVALGAQGHSAFAHLMLGSVAAKVVAASRIPVLLLR